MARRYSTKERLSINNRKNNYTTFALFAVCLLGMRPPFVFAAPCCSANAAAPSLISGDDAVQVTLLASHQRIVGDVTPDGVSIFRAANHNEVTENFRLEGAWLVGDRWQVGAEVPLVRRSLSQPGIDNAATRLGDIRLDVAYEVLPEWSYSVWNPKGYVFLQAIVPTGRSIYDSQQTGAVDASGQGFYTLAVGGLFLKRWGNWDVYLLPEVHHAWGRGFESALTQEHVSIEGGWGASAALGVGVSPGGEDLRVGLRIQPTYASAKNVFSSSGTSQTATQLNWETALELAYLLADQWSVSASYFDQTLLGPAQGTTLARGVTVSLQCRWPR
jgi:hypothetical protein